MVHHRHGWNFLCRLAISIMVLFSCGTPLAVQAETSTDRIIRVGYYTMENFQEYDSQTGTYLGYGYDYLEALSQYAGWEYEFVPVTYETGIQMLASGELDIMNGVLKKSDQPNGLLYSSIAAGERYTSLVVSDSNQDVSFNDYGAISTLTVGLDYKSEANDGFVNYCKDNDCMPRIIYYHSAADVAAGMAGGEINACLASSYENTGLRAVAKFNVNPYYIGVAKGDTEVLEILNRAMNDLKTEDPYFEDRIYQKYHQEAAVKTAIFSLAEKEYIASSPVIRVAYDPSWYPLAYQSEDGSFTGAMAALMAEVSARSGLTFTYVAAADGADAVDMLREGRADVLAGFPYDYAAAQDEGALITLPFATLAVYAVHRKDAASGDALALPEGSYLRYLTEKIQLSAHTYTEYGTSDACMEAVMEGQADYTLVDAYQMAYYSGRAHYQSLSYQIQNMDSYNLSLAVSKKSDSQLYSIISKSLSSLSEDTVNSVMDQAVKQARSNALQDVLYANPQLAVWLYTFVGVLAAILVSFLFYSRKISAKNRQLEQATNAKARFLSNMSHDMRTPLNGILGYTRLALAAEDPAKKADYLQKIDISGNLMMSLINDTLDVSKIESGKYGINSGPVDFDDLLNGITVPISETAEARGVRFTVDTSGMRKGKMITDSLQLQKVILNLLSNAVKFTPKGGLVQLVITYLDPPMDGFNTRITVRDSGIGMSEEFMRRMYEPFSQEQLDTSGATVGTGLGLSIVKGIVDLMKGRIDVKSSPGQGTQFDVLLPIVYPAASEEKGPAVQTAPAKDALRGKTVLLCEDNAMNREIATLFLEGFGVRVLTAANGREGLEAFRQSAVKAVDAVLMDLRMPVMDGYEAARAIRHLDRPDAGTVPIIAMSADVYEEGSGRFTESGIDAQVPKPVDQDQLYHELVRACRKDRREEE